MGKRRPPFALAGPGKPATRSLQLVACNLAILSTASLPTALVASGRTARSRASPTSTSTSLLLFFASSLAWPVLRVVLLCPAGLAAIYACAFSDSLSPLASCCPPGDSPSRYITSSSPALSLCLPLFPATTGFSSFFLPRRIQPRFCLGRFSHSASCCKAGSLSRLHAWYYYNPSVRPCGRVSFISSHSSSTLNAAGLRISCQ